MPQVSVCIPTFNRCDYLRQALDSVFEQTWKDFEVVVVDDGSTDGTAEMVRAYPHPVRYVYQENQGEAAARNRLVDEARAPLVAWLDSDDLWLPDKLEKQMPLLRGEPERTVVFGPKMSIDARGNVTRREARPIATGRITAALFERTFIPIPSVVVPVDLLRETGGFDRRYTVSCDYRTWLILSLSCGFVAHREALVMCRRHESNVSAPTAAKQRMKVAMLEEFYFELGGREAIPRVRAMRRLSRECRKASTMARREGERPEAIKSARKALGYRVTARGVAAYLAASLGRGGRV